MEEHLAKVKALLQSQKKLLARENVPAADTNGIIERYQYPVLTAAHTPIFWRYDLNKETNPFVMERQGINATFNAGAILWNNRIVLAVRVEGVDRKSFFALAESDNGIDNFCFRDFPITIPETAAPDTNVYDMRLTAHEDGWIYGLFCTERRDHSAKNFDQSSAVAQCGIVRTKDLERWERLQDLQTNGGQQRNVVLHPEFIEGKYGLYTRPQDGFIDAGKGGGIGWGLCKNMERAEVEFEKIIEPKIYHTIKEVKNGQGPAPIKTDKGWLHLAHGVRNTAAGLRYVLYLFMTDLKDPSLVTHRPAGHFIAPEGEERVGDVSNVVFSNGWILRNSNEVLIYYASSDTRLHVATSKLEKLVDYCIHTPEDGLRSASSVQNRSNLITKNLKWMKENLNG
jgi:4-O-beta-D-mannosyl-D-glucose phosphorylase